MSRAGGLRSVLAAFMATLALPSVAHAADVQFDDLSEGTVVTDQIPGVVFPDSPQVFDPQNTTTATGHNALRASRACNGGCHRLEIRFEEPTSFVSVRVGVDSVRPFEFPIEARLDVFNGDGAWGGSSPVTQVAEHNQYGPITTKLEVNRFPGQDIASAVLFVGKSDTAPAISPGYAVRVDLDDLRFSTPRQPRVDAEPRIEITDPPEGTTIAGAEINIAGKIEAPAGVRVMCATAETAAEPPESCRGVPYVEDDPATPETHTFSNWYVRNTHQGENQVTAWVRDLQDRWAKDTITIHLAKPPEPVDVRAETMEVTQGIQHHALPVPTRTEAGGLYGDQRLGPVRLARYQGVPLAQGRRTVVRLFASARGVTGDRAPELRRVPAFVYGFERRDGRIAQIGNPLRPIGVTTLGGGFRLEQKRAERAGAYTFILPFAWTEPEGGELILVGVVNRPVATLAECGLQSCAENNAFGISTIRFTEMREVTIDPVSMTYDGRGEIANFAQPFNETRRLLPAPVTVRPLRGVINTTNMDVIEDLLALLASWDTTQSTPAPGKVVGLRPGTGTGIGQVGGKYAVTPNVVRGGRRPVAHEVGHTLGFLHAGTSPECYAIEKDRGESWPPDQRGRIQGVGLDVGADAVAGHFEPLGTRESGVFESALSAPAESLDFMSYCATNALAWISVRYWTEAVERLAVGGSANISTSVPRARAAGAVPGLAVSAGVDPAGQARVLSVQPERAEPTPSDETSPYRLVVRGASDRVISDIGVTARPLHADPENPGEPAVQSLQFSAVVPGAKAQAVQLLYEGKVVAERRRSPSAPRITRVASGRSGKGHRIVSWRAADADGDALHAFVEFSADDGRTWRTVGVAPQTSRLALPDAVLEYTRAGRLRVTVSDGFNRATKTTGRFQAAGRPPTVTLLSPARRLAVPADAPVLLSGYAFDDAGRRISPKRLRWRSGNLTIGTGETATVPAFALGSKVTLEARDARGRIGRTSAKVKVVPVPPIFLELKAPAKLASDATRVKLRVASTLPGTLQVGSETHEVGLAERSLGFSVPPGEGDIVLGLALSAGGKITRKTLTIRRPG